MRTDAVDLEEGRLGNLEKIEDYPWFKERHRVFPAVFENRQHKNILDLAAGVGCSTMRIRDNYPANLVCSDITPVCLELLHNLSVPTVAFDIDAYQTGFPLRSKNFDAVVSLVTIEHVIHTDDFMKEIYRILDDEGYLYISTPNYAAPEYLYQPLIRGKTYHDPLDKNSRYEFFAHVRYFTYKTLIEYVSSFDFVPDTVYLMLPGGSTRYKELYANARWKALSYRYAMWFYYNMFPAGWASEPIVCFQKTRSNPDRKLRKVIL